MNKNKILHRSSDQQISYLYEDRVYQTCTFDTTSKRNSSRKALDTQLHISNKYRIFHMSCREIADTATPAYRLIYITYRYRLLFTFIIFHHAISTIIQHNLYLFGL